MDVVFKRDGQKSYMIAILEKQSISEDDYRLKMLQNNQIPGLLDVTVTFVDDHIELAYDITSKSSLDIYWMKGNVTYQQICELHQGMFQMMWNIKKYLLKLNHVVLETRFIFLDHKTKMPYFCYIPDETYDFFDSSKHFYKELIGIIDYGDEQGVKLAYQLEKLAVQDDFHMDKIQEAMGWKRNEAEGKKKLEDCVEKLEKNPYEEEYESLKIKEESYDSYLQEKKNSGKNPWIEEESFGKIKETLRQKLNEIFKIKIGKEKKEKGRQEEKSGIPEIQVRKEEQEKKTEKNCKTEVLRKETEQLVLLNIHAKQNIQMVVDHPFPKVLGSEKQECDLVIEDDSAVSRVHAKFSEKEQQYYVQDLNSTNGTKLNEEELLPYTETKICDGDLLQIGKSLFKVRIGMF